MFERHNVTFVSVTQQFNTTTSMGRLTLNILLSFAQFEREVIGEGIRDKLAASRKKGLWMGGWPPLGYEVENRRLVVVEREATLVRRIFDRFAKTGSALRVARELNATGEVTKRRACANGTRGGKSWTKGAVYKLLANRVYLGEAVHKGVAYPGEHAAIVDQRTWDRAHAVMAEPAHRAAPCQSARNGDPGSACKRDPCAGEVEDAGVVDAEPLGGAASSPARRPWEWAWIRRGF